MYLMGMGPKVRRPLFLFAINLIGFFRVDCPTLSKINRAVFSQWSFLNALTQRRARVKMAEQAELIGSKDTRLAGQRSSSMSACNVC